MGDKSDWLEDLVAADATIIRQAKEINRLLERVAELRAASGDQWIPVSDRLPADGEWCWVHGANFNGPFPAVRRRASAGGWHNEDTWEDWDGEVERWFPIAQPPAAEGGD
jgi:hypothetical protein